MKQCFTAAFLGIVMLAAAAPAADLGLSASTIDYGTVREGPPVIKTVILTNNGTETLTIANASAS
ncbi:MAG: hypothetical protein JXR49_18925 [Acidobacteria bacterium]|nr:hypothetical protein [Acidobacteriota bacterium]